MAVWFLSFAGDDRWLGGLVVEAGHAIAAVEWSHIIGMNPGGQVMILRCDGRRMRRYPRDRLLSRAELEQLGGVVAEWS